MSGGSGYAAVLLILVASVSYSQAWGLSLRPKSPALDITEAQLPLSSQEPTSEEVRDQDWIGIARTLVRWRFAIFAGSGVLFFSLPLKSKTEECEL